MASNSTESNLKKSIKQAKSAFLIIYSIALKSFSKKIKKRPAMLTTLQTEMRLCGHHFLEQIKLRKILKYTRGHIKVLYRQGLEDSARECYQIVKTEHDGTKCG